MNGWVCLHRAIRENPRYRDSEWVHVWIELLLCATHSAQAVVFGGKKITLNPGQLVTGRKLLAAKTGVNESKIQRILKLMETEQQIEQLTTNASRLITIVNWSAYQFPEQHIEQQTNNKRTTNEQPTNTFNNGNKGYKENTLTAGDDIHKILVSIPQLQAMTYEQDLIVRQDYRAAPTPVDWTSAAHETVKNALLMSEPLSNPALFWRSQLRRFMDGKSSSAEKIKTHTREPDYGENGPILMRGGKRRE